MSDELQRLIIQNNLIGYIPYKSKAKTILDLGCGPGFTTINLAKSNPGSLVYGIDYSEEFINYAKKQKKIHKLENISFILGDVRNLYMFSSETIDLIHCQFLFNQLNSPELCIEEMHRILAPIGNIVILEGINKQWEWPFPTAEEIEHDKIFTQKQYAKGNNPDIALELCSMLSHKFDIQPSLELSSIEGLSNATKYLILRMFIWRMKANGLKEFNVLQKFRQRLFQEEFVSYTYLLRIIGRKK